MENYLKYNNYLPLISDYITFLIISRQKKYDRMTYHLLFVQHTHTPLELSELKSRFSTFLKFRIVVNRIKYHMYYHIPKFNFTCVKNPQGIENKINPFIALTKRSEEIYM